MIPGGRSLLLLACGVLPFSGGAQAQVNLDFETPVVDASGLVDGAVPGWRVTEAAAGLDTATRRSGIASLRVASGEARSRTGFSQELDVRAAQGDRVRIVAYVRGRADQAGIAALRVRIASETGLIYFDRNDAPRASTAGEWVRVVIEAPLAPEAVELSFGGELGGRGEVWFDDFSVEFFDAASLPPPSAAALRYVNYALSLVDEHALVRAQLDWPEYRARVLRQARGADSAADAYLALRHALALLGDGHSYFMSAAQVAALADGPVENARTRRPVIAPYGEIIEGAIGYLRLPGFAGGSHIDRVEFAEALQRMIAELDAAACGFIVDLRDNSGGNLWPMLAGLGPLLGDGEVGASVSPAGERRRFWYEDGKAGLDDYVQLRVRDAAYRLRRSSAPIAVITDRRTASAGEILAVGFSTRAHTRRFGETTRGATTATRTFSLSDGAALVLAVASISDRDGRLYIGPIEPDEVVAARERDLSLPEQPAIRAALDWLAGEPAASATAGCGSPGA